MRKKANGYMPPIYKSYVFRDKDPAIDALRTVVQQSYGKLTTHELVDIEANGGPSHACMSAWFFGKTKRPQNATLEAAGRAMGYERAWKKMAK